MPNLVSKATRLFLFLLGASFATASVVYVLLRLVMPHGYVFGALFRMFLYHWAHPFQYIAIVCLAYAILTTLAISANPHLTGTRRSLVILILMPITILVASPAGGVLWHIHDMQAGYVPAPKVYWWKIRGGAVDGLLAGWLIILLSVPYNLIGVVVGYYITLNGYDLAKGEPPRIRSAVIRILRRLRGATTNLPNRR